VPNQPPKKPLGGLDDLDRRILIELQEDGRRSYREIGSRLGVSAGTARARAVQLMDDGLVEVVAHPNPWKMGFEFFALIGLSVDGAHVDDVAEALTAREEVTYVALANTGFDIFAEVVFENAQSFGRYKNEVLAELPGVRTVEVFVLWDVRKVRYHLGEPVGPSTPGESDGDGQAAA
jgi:Lrp/AsnC family transcriptional regulator, regulator for asnA, asnC and gidA